MESAARFAVLIAMILLGIALADLLLRDRSVVALGEPRWAGERVEALAVDLPQIRDFDYYYGGEGDEWRNLNPFIPFTERAIERARLEDKKKPRQPEERNVIEAVPPSVNEVEIEIPDLALPPLAETQKLRLPEVMGRMGMGGVTYVLVRYDGKTWRMTPGERVDTWTLSGIQQGEAIFLDEHGEQWRVRIGKSSDEPANRLGEHAVGTSNPPPPAGSAGAGAAQLKEQLAGALSSGDVQSIRAILTKADPAARRELMNDPEVKRFLNSPMAQALLKNQFNEQR